MRDRIYVALDVETTGLVAGVDEIIEVAAVRFRGDEVLETYSQLVRPRQALPLKITRLTGITPEHLAQAPRFNAIGAELARFIGKDPLVGHSIGFDINMLRAQGMHFAQPVYDTFELATLLIPQAPVYRLGALADYLGIPHPQDHRALNDALVAARIFVRLLQRISALALDDLTEIVRLTQPIDFPLRPLFEDALRRRLKQTFTEAPRRPPRERASVGESPPLKPTGNAQSLDVTAVAAFFTPDGPLGRRFPSYEPRPSQAAMACAVAQAFNSGEPLLVEAGTGTGKSLAYLVPAALFAIARGERVVISTNTINLQDQLFFKDIPTLQQIMTADDRPSAGDATAPPFTAALLKGRGNYLCLKRYHELRRTENLTPDEVRALIKVQLWLPTTSTGDRAELPLLEGEHNTWNRMNVTPDSCTGPRCAHFRECFFFKARRAAEAAHIVVVNHSLLIADLAAQTSVLPPYDHLIIDEAHNLEDVATDQLSFSIDQAALLTFLDDVFQEGGAHIVSGLLAELPARLREGLADERTIETVEQIAEHLRPALTRARTAVYDCFNRLATFMTGEVHDTQYDPRLRLTPTIRKRPVWQDIAAAWSNLSDTLVVIGDGLGKLESLLRELDPDAIPDYDELLLRVEHLRRFASDVRVRTGHIIFGDETSITWLTHDRTRDTLTLTAAPLKVAEILQAQLFAQKQTVVLTSATLTVAGRFDFIAERIGLSNARELLLESPFDYERQALVYIPDDIPEPNQRGYQQAVEQALITLCTATGGRTLALFTANGALKQTYMAIQEALEEQEIAVLAQGIDGSRRALLERFKESPRTVLLGTASFWEGVDVVGEALSVLVITKLPFSVPTDPVFAARSEQFSDPFGDYAVPQSILRFKQGFGRLIRSAEDRGVVVCLDRRLLTKKYGQQFLDSLPHTQVRTGPLKRLPALAARFLEK